jgi:putative hydrolase of the HAD superfamily
MPAVKAVTFDLSGTLLFPQPSVGAVYATCAKRHGIAVDAVALEAAFGPALRSAHRPAKPEVFWREVVERTFGAALPASKAETVFRECWNAFGDAKSWRTTTGIVSVIGALKFLGIKVAVLSNADARLRRVLEQKDLARHFDAIYLSDEIGCAKPDAKAFAHAARGLGVALTALVHIGDSPTEDGEGPRDAGAVGVIVGGRHAPERCLRVERLAEVPKLIQALLNDGKPRGKLSRRTLNLLANLRGLPEDRSRSTERDLKSLDDAMGEAFRKLRLDKPVPEDAIIAHWSELLPMKLARRAAPLKVVEGGRLVIQCENAVIKTELRFRERALLAKIRELPGCLEVRSLAFVNA